MNDRVALDFELYCNINRGTTQLHVATIIYLYIHLKSRIHVSVLRMIQLRSELTQLATHMYDNKVYQSLFQDFVPGVCGVALASTDLRTFC